MHNQNETFNRSRNKKIINHIPELKINISENAIESYNSILYHAEERICVLKERALEIRSENKKDDKSKGNK